MSFVSHARMVRRQILCSLFPCLASKINCVRAFSIDLGKGRFWIFGMRWLIIIGVANTRIARHASIMEPRLGKSRMQNPMPKRLIRSKKRIQIRLVRPTENLMPANQRARAGRANSPRRIGAKLLAVLCRKLIPSASSNENSWNTIQVRSPRSSQLTEPSRKITPRVTAGIWLNAVSVDLKSRSEAAIPTVKNRIAVPKKSF